MDDNKKEVVKTDNQGKVELPDFIKRMNEEFSDLQEKIKRITEFQQTDTYKGLDPYQQQLLAAQCSAMIAYANILVVRINGETNLFVLKQKMSADQKK